MNLKESQGSCKCLCRSLVGSLWACRCFASGRLLDVLYSGRQAFASSRPLALFALAGLAALRQCLRVSCGLVVHLGLVGLLCGAFWVLWNCGSLVVGSCESPPVNRYISNRARPYDVAMKPDSLSLVYACKISDLRLHPWTERRRTRLMGRDGLDGWDWQVGWVTWILCVFEVSFSPQELYCRRSR